MHIENAVGLVTGGASGLGAGTARMLVDRGAKVGILDLPASLGEELASSLGDAAVFVPCDVTDEAGVAEAVASVVDRFGRIDVCVNAAGISPAARVLSRKGDMHSLELFRKTLDINLTGAFDVLRNAVAAMARNEPGESGERGLIVNVSSVSALEGQAGQAAYSASKGALVSLTLPLARDLAIWGIRVVTVCPGIMDTGLLADADDQRRAALTDLHVFPKRLGTPADFARLVLEFMENELINGETVRLDAAARL